MTNSIAEKLIFLFSPEGFGSIISFLLLVLEGLYLIFAFLLIRQVAIKNKSVKTQYAFLFTVLTWVHFFTAIVVFLTSVSLL